MILKAVTLLTAAALSFAGFKAAPNPGSGYCKHHVCPTTSTTSTTMPTTTTVPTTTTSPTTTTTPPPPPPPPPNRLWSADSPWNTPISSDATADPNSAAMILSLATTTYDIVWKSYGVALYYANANTPRYEVLCTAQSPCENLHLTVPLPAGIVPATGTDGHFSVIDNDPTSPTYQCEFDFLHPKVTSTGGFDYSSPSSNYLQREKTTESGFLQGFSTRGSSDANMGGTITPQDFVNGVIPHALPFYVPNARFDGNPGHPYLPSYTSDGTSLDSNSIPESARLRLNPNYDLSGLPQWQQIIGAALKKYGAYVIDKGGHDIAAVANPSTPYPWGADTYPTIPLSMVQNLQVLTLGAQSNETYNIIPTHPCGNWH